MGGKCCGLGIVVPKKLVNHALVNYRLLGGVHSGQVYYIFSVIIG